MAREHRRCSDHRRNSDGQIDLAHLERELQRYKDRPLKIYVPFLRRQTLLGLVLRQGRLPFYCISMVPYPFGILLQQDPMLRLR